jgi:uncharacterized lipoprotein YajG
MLAFTRISSHSGHVFNIQQESGASMRLLSIALATLVLAACATQPQPTPQAPGGGRLDAKTQLETGRR